MNGNGLTVVLMQFFLGGLVGCQCLLECVGGYDPGPHQFERAVQ